MASEDQTSLTIAPADQSIQVVTSKDNSQQTVFTAYVDSGVTYNFANSLELVHSFTPFEMGVLIATAAGSSVCALGHGMVGVIPFVYAPSLRRNLVSVSAMADLGISISLAPGGSMHGHEVSELGQLGPYYGSVSQESNGLFVVSMEVAKPSVPGGTAQSALTYPAAFKIHQAQRACTMEMASPESDAAQVRFLVDTGATHCVVNTLRGVSLDPALPRLKLKLADGSFEYSVARGYYQGLFPVIYLPTFTHNLCSVGALGSFGYDLQLGEDGSGNLTHRETGHHLSRVLRAGNLYYTTFPFVQPVEPATSRIIEEPESGFTLVSRHQKGSMNICSP